MYSIYIRKRWLYFSIQTVPNVNILPWSLHNHFYCNNFQVPQFSYSPEDPRFSVDPVQPVQQHIYKHQETPAQQIFQSVVKTPANILEKAGIAMKHIAGMTGLQGGGNNEQHKFQLIYSNEPAEVDAYSEPQLLNLGKLIFFPY